MRRTEPIRVVYVVPRFPVLSQSFVLTEFDRVRREVPAEIAALFSSRESVVHPIAAELLPSVIFVPLVSFSMIRSNVRWLMRRPAKAISRPSVERCAAASGVPPEGWREEQWSSSRRSRSWTRSSTLRATHIHAHFIHHPATAAWVINRLSRIPFSVTAHADDLYCGPALLQEKTRGCRSRRRRFPHVQPPVHPRADTRSVRASGHPLRDRASSSFLTRPRERYRRFACVARLQPKKGHGGIGCWAFAVAAAQAPDLSLELVGDGAEHVRVADLARRLGIENLVHLHGAMPSHAVRELLDDCDVFVLAAIRTGSTSFQRGCMDGIPVALMEAMASGLPVISTSISGIPELVVERAGVLVSPGDVSALAQAILEVHRDAALGSSHARRARQHVERALRRRRPGRQAVGFLVSGASPNWKVVQGTAADATGPN